MQIIIVAAIAGAVGFYAGILLMCALRMWDHDEAEAAPRRNPAPTPDQHA